MINMLSLDTFRNHSISEVQKLFESKDSSLVEFRINGLITTLLNNKTWMDDHPGEVTNALRVLCNLHKQYHLPSTIEGLVKLLNTSDLLPYDSTDEELLAELIDNNICLYYRSINKIRALAEKHKLTKISKKIEEVEKAKNKSLSELLTEGNLTGLKRKLTNPQERTTFLNTPDQQGFYPLQTACLKGHLDMAKWLVEQGASTTILTKRGSSLLHCAGNGTIAQWLIVDHGADVLAQNKAGFTPLHYACQDGYFEVAEVLLQNGASITIPPAEGSTPFHEAFNKNNLQIIELMLNTIVESNDYPSMQAVCLMKHFRSIINQLDKKTGMNLLHIACSKGHLGVAKFLVSIGADMNLTTREGLLPLHCAQSSDVTQWLIEKGADVNATDSKQRTALHHACLLGNFDVVATLLQNDANPNAAAEDGETPLHFAYQHASAAVVEFLLQNGADMRATDHHNNSSLHYAIQHAEGIHVQTLIDSGADINAQNDEGNTPAHLAVSPEALRRLITAGADLTLRNNKNEDFFKICPVPVGAVMQSLGYHDQTDADLFICFFRGNRNELSSHLCQQKYSNKDLLELITFAQSEYPKMTTSLQMFSLVMLLECSPENTPETALLIRKARELGADFSKDSLTLLHHFCDDIELLDELVQAGVDINTVNYNNESLLLHISEFAGWSPARLMSVVLFCLKQGANSNIQDTRAGNTPLHYLGKSGIADAPLVYELIKHGANLSLTNKEGKKPMQMVGKKQKENIVKFIITALCSNDDRYRPSVEAFLECNEKKLETAFEEMGPIRAAGFIKTLRLMTQETSPQLPMVIGIFRRLFS